MSFLNDLKHLIVEEEPNAQPKEAATSVAQSTSVAPTPIVDSNLTATFVSNLREKFDTASSATLLGQFTNTLESLSEAIPEEGIRFRAALKVLAKQNGVTSDQLVGAFNDLLGVLENEASKFKFQVDKQKTTEVDARDAQMQQINAQIEAKNKEIEALMTLRDGIATDIIAAKSYIGATVASFEGAVASLQAEVGDSLQKMRIYFPAVSVTVKK